jgi:pyridoxine 5-phosphate synthase
MAATEEMVRIAIETGPRIATIVPERREELTTEGGLDAAAGGRKLKAAIAALREAEIEVSLFVDPDARQIEATLKAGADAVEIHTGAYANARDESEVQLRLMEIAAAAELADGMDLRVHAGHGLNYANVSAVAALAHLRELNIGHSIVSRAVFDGLPKAVADMARLIREASGRGAPPPSS